MLSQALCQAQKYNFILDPLNHCRFKIYQIMFYNILKQNIEYRTLPFN